MNLFLEAYVEYEQPCKPRHESSPKAADMKAQLLRTNYPLGLCRTFVAQAAGYGCYVWVAAFGSVISAVSMYVFQTAKENVT